MGLRLFWPLAALALLILVIFLVLEPWGRVPAVLTAGTVGLVGAALLARGLTARFRRAARAATEIAQGDFARRLPETEPGAPGDLYRSLNRLSEEMHRRLEEIELEKTETETLLREMGEGVLALSREGRVVRANATLRSAIGGTEPLEGKTLSALFRNPSLIEFLDPENVPVEGTEDEFQVFGRTMLVSGRRLPAGGVVAVFSDLTPIRRLQRVRTEFVANASHEMKTPLTAVRGYAETLLDPTIPESDRPDFVRRIVDHADRMSAIVDDLLTLARLEEPGRRVDRRPVRVRAVVDDVGSRLSHTGEGVELSIEVEPAGLRVRGDPEGVRQIVENLLDNALRHSGSKRIGVRARLAESGRVRITVWDRGRGIPTAHLGRVFERFYRVDPSRSRASGGTGLGLSIVKHWAEAMDGRAWAESRVGEGTEVHVDLPAV